MLPAVVRTYAPVGKTPFIRAPLSRDHLSVMGGITPQGKLYMMVQKRAYNSEDVVRFLEQLLWCIPEKLLVIWDGAPIHRGQPVKDFLASGAAGRIHLEQLPGYAPELNPAEGIWGYLKRVGLKNLCCQNIPHLRVELCRAKERLRHKVDIIKSFIKQPGFY